jgi:hypothetical protein
MPCYSSLSLFSLDPCIKPSHFLLLSLLLFTPAPFPLVLALPSFICPSDALSAPLCNITEHSPFCSTACQCATCPASPDTRCYKASLFQGSIERDAAGSALIFAVSVFCSVAGIGGGAMMLPILMSVFGFNLAAAKMLSHICVLGNVCAQVRLNIRCLAFHPSSIFSLCI